MLGNGCIQRGKCVEPVVSTGSQTGIKIKFMVEVQTFQSGPYDLFSPYPFHLVPQFPGFETRPDVAGPALDAESKSGMPDYIPTYATAVALAQVQLLRRNMVPLALREKVVARVSTDKEVLPKHRGQRIGPGRHPRLGNRGIGQVEAESRPEPWRQSFQSWFFTFAGEAY